MRRGAAPAVGAGRRTVVIISGNHDSAAPAGFGADLMEAAGVHLRTDPDRAWEPVTIGEVAFYGIPYLEPELVRGPWELAERSHTAALGHAMARIRADAAPAAPERSCSPTRSSPAGGRATASATSASAASPTCR